MRNISQLSLPKPRHLKPNKLATAVLLSCLIIVAGSFAAFALVNVQAGYATPKMTLSVPTGLKDLSTTAGAGHILVVDYNQTFIVPSQKYSLLDVNSPIATHYWAMQSMPEFFATQPGYVATWTTAPVFYVNSQPEIVYEFTCLNGTVLLVTPLGAVNF